MKKEITLPKLFKDTSYFINKYVYFLLPLITGVIFLLLCFVNNLYPFSNNTIAWCDMNQQVIPLLNTFKDILEGKQGFIYNQAHAGGMSLFSVYFFFLSSPFSYLVVFVKKSQMVNFVNLLVMFKLMMISFSMSFYLSKKYKNVNALINIALSLFFTFSTYNLMYYQNIMWLDIVYMFPLLILSIDHLLEKNKFIPYLISITTIVLLNYYLAFMVICFVLIYVGLNLIYRKNEENISLKARTFIFSSLIGALLSCFSIIPSFIQYLDSARGGSLIENIKSAWFVTHLYTTLPLILCSISVLPFLLKKDLDINRKIKFILLGLLIIPIFIDPINCMWHIGSYQAFPCRFAFMITFLVLDIVCSNLDNDSETTLSLKNIPFILLSIGLIICLYIFETNYMKLRYEDLNQYSQGLWGDSTSFESICRYYVIVLLILLVVYLIYKFKFINKKVLSFILVNASIVEILFSTSIYLVSPSRDSSNYQELYNLQEIVDDSSYYRVKTDSKLTDVNVIGGAGFNSLSHYTSLTNEDYMFTMKKLGYSSYWMEVGSHGGTSFTDALLQNKYTIYYGRSNNAKYSSEHYYLKENNILPFGLITDSDLSNYTELKEDTRVNMQEEIYDVLFNDNTNLHTVYSPSKTSDVEITSNNSRTRYEVSGQGKLTYTIYVSGKQKLYFEAFDKYSNSLSESINDKIVISGPGVYTTYPTQSKNGTIYLGEYENRTVTFTVFIKDSIEVSSLNLFSINEELLQHQINISSESPLTVSRNKIEGTYTLEEDSYLFLPISYSKGMKAKINGKKVEVEKVFSTFIAIKLSKGVNELTISYSQPGLGIGITISVIGFILLALYIYMKNKITIKKEIDKTIYYLTISLSGITILILYVLPLVINILDKLK